MEIFRHPEKADAMCAFMATRAVSTGDEPILRFDGTTGSEDRYGSVISPEGANVESYMRNPVFLWAHNYSMPPIGKTVDLKRTKRAITFDIRFAVEDFDFAATIYRLYRGGYLSGTSVGLIPLSFEEYKAKTIPSEIALNVRYPTWELLELSGVPVPANRDALKKALSDRAVAENEIRLGLERMIFRAAPYVLGFGSIENDLRMAEDFEIEAPADPAPVVVEEAASVATEERKGAVLSRSNLDRVAAIRDLAEDILATVDEIVESAKPKEEAKAADPAIVVEPAAAEARAVTDEDVAKIVRAFDMLIGRPDGSGSVMADQPLGAAGEPSDASAPPDVIERYALKILGRRK